MVILYSIPVSKGERGVRYIYNLLSPILRKKGVYILSRPNSKGERGVRYTFMFGYKLSMCIKLLYIHIYIYIYMCVCASTYIH
jgi:Zn/Cd-binding protein ZinT